MLDEDGLFEDVAPICAGMGLTLVDCRLQLSRGAATCQLVVFKKEGVSTADCALAHRTIRPRLEVLLDTQDVSLEVGSPGTDRKIRLPREYALFLGRGLAVTGRDGQVRAGILAAFDGDAVTVKTRQGDAKIALADIAKAKLDYTQEVN